MGLRVLTLFRVTVRRLQFMFQMNYRFTGQNFPMRMHLYKEHLGGMLSPPSGESLETLPPFVRHEFSIKKAKTDIVISGLGWITIQHPDVVVAVHAPRGVDVVLRPSLI